VKTVVRGKSGICAVASGVEVRIIRRGESMVVSRHVDPERRRRAAVRIVANVKRLARKRTGYTAAQALAEVRRGRL
jgi:ribosomal protein S7